MKVRASWGETGNQAISNYARYGLYAATYGGGRNESTAYDLHLQERVSSPLASVPHSRRTTT